MSTFVDHVLNPPPNELARSLTRHQRIDRARQELADAKSTRPRHRAAAAAHLRWLITCCRRTLTREVLYLRVQDGESLASLRLQWMDSVKDYREKLGRIRNSTEWIVRDLQADRARLAGDVITKGRNKGRPYSPVTIRNLQRAIASHERELAEAEPQIAAFLAAAPPSYHVWRRQQSARSIEEGHARLLNRLGGGVALALTGSAKARPVGRGNVIDLAVWPGQRRRRPLGKTEITIGEDT